MKRKTLVRSEKFSFTAKKIDNLILFKRDSKDNLIIKKNTFTKADYTKYGYNDYQIKAGGDVFMMRDYIYEYIESTLIKPLYNDLRSSRLLLSAASISDENTYQLNEAFEEITEGVYFYDFTTNLIDEYRKFQVGIIENQLYLQIQLLIFNIHLTTITQYVQSRSQDIQSKDYKDYIPGEKIPLIKTDWDIGKKNIGSFLSLLDSNICRMESNIHYCLSECSKEYFVLNIILVIP